MWKKTLGLVVVLFAFLFTMEGCATSRRAYYRPGYAPVNVRVVRPAYRYNNRYDYKHHKRDKHHRHHDRDHHRH